MKNQRITTWHQHKPAMFCLVALTLSLTIFRFFAPAAMGADSQNEGQITTELYADQLTNARRYPLAQMTDSAERANLTERLLRLNNANKVGWVVLLTENGQILAKFTIRGKVSSTGSQLTPTQNAYARLGQAVVTSSMGDDGSYGPEEGGEKGIVFFTGSGILIETNSAWQYSDAPINAVFSPVVFLPAESSSGSK